MPYEGVGREAIDRYNVEGVSHFGKKNHLNLRMCKIFCTFVRKLEYYGI